MSKTVVLTKENHLAKVMVRAREGERRVKEAERPILAASAEEMLLDISAHIEFAGLVLARDFLLGLEEDLVAFGQVTLNGDKAIDLVQGRIDTL